jgi:hypothetical protein
MAGKAVLSLKGCAALAAGIWYFNPAKISENEWVQSGPREKR